MRVQKHFIRKLESRTKLVKNFRERENSSKQRILE